MSDTKAERAAALRDGTIRLVYAVILLLGITYGLVHSVIAVYLRDRGLTEQAIGDLAIFFAGGISLVAVPAGNAIKRFGPRAVLPVAVVGYCAAVGLFPFVRSYPALAALRFFDGAFSVCVWVASETVLLTRTPSSDKAFFMSLYAVALGLGYVVGPIISIGVVAVASKAASFYVAGGLAILALPLVSMSVRRPTTAHVEEHVESHGEGTLPIGTIFLRIKMSCLATFSYGYFQASVLLFLPLYLTGRGFTDEQTIPIPALFAAGMLSLVSFAAQFGDRIGHLRVMRLLGTIGTVTIVAFLFVKSPSVVYAIAFFAGASLASLSPVSLALLGLVVPKHQLSQGGALYNASYALGMLVGPPITGRVLGSYGGRTMVLHFAAMWTAFVLLSIVFRSDDPRGRRLA